MLLQIFNKLEQIEARIKYLEEEKATENKIDELIYRINNLQIDDIIKTKIPNEGTIIWHSMSLQPFSGTSKTITTERSLINKPSFLGKLLARKKKLNATLEEIIDVDRDLEIYTNHQITLLSPQILYKTPVISFNSQLLRINREEELLVTT